MNGDFLPEFNVYPMPKGGYKGAYRLFVGKNFRLMPGEAKETASQAMTAVKEYVCARLNPPIRAEQSPEPEPDPLNRARWHEERAAREAERQEEALGGIISANGKLVSVQRVKERA